MKISLSDATLRQAAESGTDAFLQTVVDAIADHAGGTLTADALARLTPDQITLWAYVICAMNSVTADSSNSSTTATALFSSSTPSPKPCAFGD